MNVATHRTLDGRADVLRHQRKLSICRALLFFRPSGILGRGLINGEELILNRSVPRRIGQSTLLVALYLVSTVPVGLFLYSLKTQLGLDLFKTGGFHAYMQCVIPLQRTPVAHEPDHALHQGRGAL